MRRVAIPLSRIPAVVRILSDGDAPERRALLDPIVAELDGVLVEDGHAVLSLPCEVADAAAAHLAAYGGIEGKLSLLFAPAEPEDDEQRRGLKP